MVTFVDDDKAQAAQEHRPTGMVSQQRQVNHVRVGEQPAGALPGKPADFGSGVAVVGDGGRVGQSGYGRAERVGRPQLVVAEGLGRRQVQRAGPRVAREAVHDRKLEGH